MQGYLFTNESAATAITSLKSMATTREAESYTAALTPQANTVSDEEQHQNRHEDDQYDQCRF